MSHIGGALLTPLVMTTTSLGLSSTAAIFHHRSNLTLILGVEGATLGNKATLSRGVTLMKPAGGFA